jgi:hypothetical protein
MTNYVRVDENGLVYSIQTKVYKVNIKNIIGISIIDNTNSEIFCITLKNLLGKYSKVIKLVKEENEEKQIKKSILNFSLDNIYINNQLEDA